MNLAILYGILADVARRKIIISYIDLNNLYFERTNEQIDCSVAMANPLSELNMHLHKFGMPPLSVVVCNKETNLPGEGFWESTPSVPSRPKDEMKRLEVFSKILRSVYDTSWPTELP